MEEVERAGTDGKAPGRSRPRRARPRPDLRVSAPKGFGGGDGTARLGDAAADAMVAASGLDALPRWWPADRLPSLRLAGVRAAIAAAATEHLEADPRDLVACSGESCAPALAEEVAAYACSGGSRALEWAGGGGDRAFLCRWLGVELLVLRGPSRTAVIGPGTIPWPPAPGAKAGGGPPDPRPGGAAPGARRGRKGGPQG